MSTHSSRPESVPSAAAARGAPCASPSALRFVWQIDEEGRFTLGSDSFLALVGPQTATILGRPWDEIAAALALDPGGHIARAIGTRATWRGVTVAWPIQASSDRVTVELSGLPVFDMDRRFRGYRGFGVWHDPVRPAEPLLMPQTAPSPPASAKRSHTAATHRPLPDPQAQANVLTFPAVLDANASGPGPLDRSALPNACAPAISGAPGRGRNAQDDVDALRCSVRELEHILEIAADGVLLIDRQRKVVAANRSAKALFGYDDLVGHAFGDLFAPESRDGLRSFLDEVKHAGSGAMVSAHATTREVTGRDRRGRPIPLWISAGWMGEPAENLCVVCRDLTRWKSAEAELTAAKLRAENASAAKSDFLTKISHEIRIPLNAIIAFSEVMMEERFGPIGNQRYREYLKDMHASGAHLLSLINDLLDLSKIEAGKLELTFSSVALNDQVQQCVAIMRPQANREGVAIETSLTPALPQIVADPRSVRQIVFNLLSNSIKFTDAGGKVTVLTTRGAGGQVVLRVRDTGIGMSEQDIATALEPFRQLTTSSRTAGTGLGLPLTKALVEANRALFRLESEPDKGTVVEIAFSATHVLAG